MKSQSRSRSFNQVSVSKVMVATTSLLIIFGVCSQLPPAFGGFNMLHFKSSYIRRFLSTTSSIWQFRHVTYQNVLYLPSPSWHLLYFSAHTEASYSCQCTTLENVYNYRMKLLYFTILILGAVGDEPSPEFAVWCHDALIHVSAERTGGKGDTCVPVL